MKPKSFRKTADRSVRVAKIATATEAIGTIEKNTDTFILTYGQFSLIDAVVAILDQIGPAHVSLSTWTAAHAHLERSAELLGSADLLSFRMIVDRSFQSRQPEYHHHMIELFGAECIRAIRTHAKFIVLRNEHFSVVCRTSMNLNENPRLENIEISEDDDFARFFESIVDEVFREVPAGSNSSTPKLNGIPESFPFAEVEAKPIPRSATNEARTTHVVRRTT